MANPYDARLDDQTARLSALGHRLDADQWLAPSLCSAWRVCDVFGHVALGSTWPLAKVVGLALRYRGDIDKASGIEAVRFADANDQATVLATYDRGRSIRIGLTRVMPAKTLFADQVIHELDVRRPLGIDDPFPADVLADAIGVATGINTSAIPAKKRGKAIRLVATDLDRSWGPADGEVLEGPGEDLLLALAGRSMALDQLDGPAVATVRNRLDATPRGLVAVPA
jgi:uncharacterized protein (TIGR03083 family)